MVFITSRVHPGETAASFMCQGVGVPYLTWTRDAIINQA